MVVVKTNKQNTIGRFHSLDQALEFAKKKILQRSSRNGWMYKALVVVGHGKKFVVTRDGIVSIPAVQETQPVPQGVVAQKDE